MIIRVAGTQPLVLLMEAERRRANPLKRESKAGKLETGGKKDRS